MKLRSFGKLFSLIAVLTLMVALACATALTASAEENVEPEITVTPYEECGKVKLTWEAVDGTRIKYAVYRNGVHIANTRKTSYIISDVEVASNGEEPVTHSFKIVALNENDEAIDYYTVEGAVSAHFYEAVVTDPDCDDQGYTTHTCSCGDSYVDSYVDALGHTEGEIVVENNVLPDCDDKGSYDNVVYCTVCDAELSREHVTVDALGHTEGEVVVENNVPTTCYKVGSYDNVVYCTVCDEELSREHITVPKLPHTPCEDWIVDPEPTCTDIGNRHIECTVCGEILEYEDIDALGHIEGEVVIEGVLEPQCEIYGSYDNVIYCTRCGEELERETIMVDPTGHTDGEMEIQNEIYPTCTEVGGYDNVKHCIVCNEETFREHITTDAIGHDFTDYMYDNNADCDTPGTKTAFCNNGCHETDTIVDPENPATGHVEGAWEIETPATCTEKGVEVVKCTKCLEVLKSSELEPLGHTAGDWITDNEATCTENGSKHIACTVCGETLSTGNIPAIGHSYTVYTYDNNKTCTVDGTKSSICDNGCGIKSTVVDEENLATGHVEGEAVVENSTTPSCTTPGQYDSVVYCSVCNTELSRKVVIVDGTGHKASEWKLENAPTCTEKGSQYKDCTVCGEKLETEEIDALGHNDGEWIIDTAPTCTEGGSRHKECTVCGATTKTESLEANGHSESEWKTDVTATCTSNGHKFTTCTVCGVKVNEETIPAIGHSYTNYVADNNATCTENGTLSAICDNGCGTKDVKENKEDKATGHSGGTATCKALAVCEKCDTAYGELADHKGGIATCKELAICEVCNAEYGKLAAHKGGNATCIKKANCDYCGEEYGEFGPHTGGNATCLDKAVCEICSQPYGEAKNHSFTNYKPNGDATCTADGTETAKCDRCDVTDTRADADSKLGHSFTNYASNNDATCTTDGTKTAKCDRCDVTDTQTDAGTALGHNPVLEDNPEEFVLYNVCTNCGEKTRAKVQIPVSYREPLLKGGIILVCVLVIIFSINALVKPATTTPWYKRRRY